MVEQFKKKKQKKTQKAAQSKEEKEYDRRAILDSIASFLPASKRDGMERALKEKHSKYNPTTKVEVEEEEEEQKEEGGEVEIRHDDPSRTEEELEAEHQRLIKKYKYKGPKKAKKGFSP